VGLPAKCLFSSVLFRVMLSSPTGPLLVPWSLLALYAMAPKVSVHHLRLPSFDISTRHAPYQQRPAPAPKFCPGLTRSFEELELFSGYYLK
jgi:hypothetical protein